mmetsp:Transcript_20354/g.58866  ORF Transcript_20354/g.58866 Transcript_20354/m.58866 type:complete len:339 (+) Transcript_20354:1186-2202(+)
MLAVAAVVRRVGQIRLGRDLLFPLGQKGQGSHDQRGPAVLGVGSRSFQCGLRRRRGRGRRRCGRRCRFGNGTTAPSTGRGCLGLGLGRAGRVVLVGVVVAVVVVVATPSIIFKVGVGVGQQADGAAVVIVAVSLLSSSRFSYRSFLLRRRSTPLPRPRRVGRFFQRLLFLVDRHITGLLYAIFHLFHAIASAASSVRTIAAVAAPALALLLIPQYERQQHDRLSQSHGIGQYAPPALFGRMGGGGARRPQQFIDVKRHGKVKISSSLPRGGVRVGGEVPPLPQRVDVRIQRTVERRDCPHGIVRRYRHGSSIARYPVAAVRLGKRITRIDGSRPRPRT